MPDQITVLLLGGTGRTGRLVLQQLLDRGARVCAIVRSAGRLTEGVAGNDRLTLIEADLLSLPEEDLQGFARGCDAVISCLGHTTTTLKGIFGPPKDLVTQALARACAAVQALRPEEPVKLVLMSSVSVNGPGGADARRGAFEKALLWVLRGLVPPAADNQNAADLLHDRIGVSDPAIQWVAVRPDTLVEGDVSEYRLHEGLVSSLAHPDSTNMANVAHFMCELVTQQQLWDAWKGKLPVIINAASA